jgi:hypothetical protein
VAHGLGKMGEEPAQVGWVEVVLGAPAWASADEDEDKEGSPDEEEERLPASRCEAGADRPTCPPSGT